MEAVENKEIVIEMEECRFVETGDPIFPKIKIIAVKLLMSIYLIEEEIVIDGGTMIGYILHDIICKSEIVFDKKMNIRSEV